MLREAIKKLVDFKDLTSREVECCFDEIMSGKASEIVISSFITALRMKKETPQEIASAASVMYKHCKKIIVEDGVELIDTCGTGGDGSFTFNISTIVGIILASAGCKVAKHGNVSISSHCGSADLLRELNVNIMLSPEGIAECIRKVNIGFIFAPQFHEAMKHVSPVRKELGIRTIFNILGPLTNPAGAKYQLLGVYSCDLVEKLCHTLMILGKKKAAVVHGIDDGIDELSITGPTKVAELKDNKISIYEVRPQDFGIPQAKLSDIQTKSVEENKEIAINILKGREEGSRKDIVLLNAGFALYIYNKVSTPRDGIELAERVIKEGRAYDTLMRLVEISNSLNKRDSLN